MERAKPLEARAAILFISVLVKIPFVTTNPIVVFAAAPFLSHTCSPSSARHRDESAKPPPSARRIPARTVFFSSYTSPSALTTTSAPACTSPCCKAHIPCPDFMANSAPCIFPTVAPVPAPKFPSRGSFISLSTAALYPIELSG